MELRTRILPRMLNSEVEAYLKENDIIIVPVGTVEMHGGMPLDSETVISEAYALKMAEACNGLVLTGLPYFYAGATASGRGTVQVSIRQGISSGIRVGLNMTSATGKYNDLMADQDYNNKSYMGYSIHYFIDVPVIGNFSIQPAVGLSMKGITYEYDKFTTKKSHRLDLDSYKKYDVTESRGTSVTQKHNLGYLDVPILFAYALPLSESFRVQLGVGPYFSYGLFGKFKYESDKYLTVSPDKYGENKHTITKDDCPSFGKNDDADDPKGNINRFDWGIAVQGSIYWKRLFLNVAYQKGLKSANITDEKNEGKDKLALSNLSLGLGFIF